MVLLDLDRMKRNKTHHKEVYYLAVIKVPYVGINVATAENKAATERALTKALLLPI